MSIVPGSCCGAGTGISGKRGKVPDAADRILGSFGMTGISPIDERRLEKGPAESARLIAGPPKAAALPRAEPGLAAKPATASVMSSPTISERVFSAAASNGMRGSPIMSAPVALGIGGRTAGTELADRPGTETLGINPGAKLDSIGMDKGTEEAAVACVERHTLRLGVTDGIRLLNDDVTLFDDIDEIDAAAALIADGEAVGVVPNNAATAGPIGVVKSLGIDTLALVTLPPLLFKAAGVVFVAFTSAFPEGEAAFEDNVTVGRDDRMAGRDTADIEAPAAMGWVDVALPVEAMPLEVCAAVALADSPAALAAFSLSLSLSLRIFVRT